MYKLHSCCAFIFSVFFFFGICSLLLGGCNTNLDGQCIAYDVVEGIAYGKKFTSKKCKKCIRYIKGSCAKYRYYDCYSAYVKFHYGNNETCFYATAKDKRSQNASIDSVNSYSNGDVKNLLKERRSSSDECFNMSKGMQSWIIGVSLLSFSVVVCVLWASTARGYKKILREHDKRTAVPTVEIL